MQETPELLPGDITAGYLFVNTGGICENITRGHNYRSMKKDEKRRPPTSAELAEQKLEGAALKKIFLEKKEAGWEVEVKNKELPQNYAGQMEGLTQASLAAAMGFTQPMISHMFAGIRRITKEHAIGLAGALGVNVEDFSKRLAAEIQSFTTAGFISEPTASYTSEVKFSKQMRIYRDQAVQKLLKLPEHRIKEWLDYADFLLTKDPPPQREGGSQENG